MNEILMGVLTLCVAFLTLRETKRMRIFGANRASAEDQARRDREQDARIEKLLDKLAGLEGRIEKRLAGVDTAIANLRNDNVRMESSVTQRLSEHRDAQVRRDEDVFKILADLRALHEEETKRTLERTHQLKMELAQFREECAGKFASNTDLKEALARMRLQ